MAALVAAALGRECRTARGASTICVPATSWGVPMRASSARWSKSAIREVSSARRAKSDSMLADAFGSLPGDRFPIALLTWASSSRIRSRWSRRDLASACAASRIRRTWSAMNASASALARATASVSLAPVTSICNRLLVRPVPR